MALAASIVLFMLPRLFARFFYLVGMRSFSMNLSAGSTQAPVDQKPQSEAYKRLRGGWLIFGRILWIVIVVSSYALFVANISAYFASLHLVHPPDLQTF